MAKNKGCEDVYNHGMALDPSCERVQCNYCGEVVCGFPRLQHHLLGTGGYGKACPDAPSYSRNSAGSNSRNMDGRKVIRGARVSVQSGTPSKKRRFTTNSEGVSMKIDCDGVGNSESGEPIKRKRVQAGSNTRSTQKVRTSCGNGKSQGKLSCQERGDSSANLVKQCIGAFFFENGIEFNVVESHSFRRMLESVVNVANVASHIPSCRDLKGHIFSDELNCVKNYVEEVRKTWSNTGCSILLDGWTDDRGHDLINFIVECPSGPVYLRSADISAVAKNNDALLALIGGVIEEVGQQNVVQIISHTSSGLMSSLGRQVMEKHLSLFWTVSATHCISIMLQKIGILDSVAQILDKAKSMTRYIYSHATTLKLMKRHIQGSNLVKSSRIKAAAPFLTLENILMEKKNLENMFSSSEWANCPLALTNEGQKVVKLVFDKPFWGALTVSVQAAIPLVKALSLINGGDGPHMGLMYETMDQVKETIFEELKGRKSQYLPVWHIIDEIWNTILHSPLHAAGYFLNPSLHYTEDFQSDSEVANGLLTTIFRMVEDQRGQDLVSQQLDAYRGCQGAFRIGFESDRNNDELPAAWWSHFGSHCPDLQKLAIRVLSQTCNGAESYRLKRNLAEILLRSGDTLEQQRLADLVYLQHNLQLKQCRSGKKFNIQADDIELMDDWILEDVTKSCKGSSSSRIYINVEELSGAQPKAERI